MTSTSPLLVAEAWFHLFYLEIVWLRGFKAIRRVVLPRTTGRAESQEDTLAAVLSAMDTARLFYIKQVMCLQSSAAIVRLLRRHGVDAEVVIGAHLMPMRAHAWVEVAGRPVTDMIEDQECFCILDRW